METKFKVGDYVVRTAHNNEVVRVGEVYRVRGLELEEWPSYTAGYGLFLEGIEPSLSPSYFELHKETKVLNILRQYVAFKKKASDNKGRNQSKKANGKPKVSKSAKTT